MGYVTYQTGSAFSPFQGLTPPVPAESAFTFRYIFLLRSCRLMDVLIISPLPPSVVGRLLTAGSLCSPDVTPVHCSYEPFRHPLAFRFTSRCYGYRTYLAPRISPWDEEGFSSCSACPCHRAIATTPPEWMAVSISFRLSMLPSPYGWGLGLWGFALSGPPVRSLSLRPGDSLTSLKDCFVDGLQILGFPPICHPSYRVPDSYPGRTNSCRTCQPLLDAQPCMNLSTHTAPDVRPFP
jgi:hypothetical protein